MKKRFFVCLLAILTAVFPACLSGCGKDATETVYLSVTTDAHADIFEKAAKAYKDETGKTVTVRKTTGKTDDLIKSMTDEDMKTTVFIIENAEEYDSLKDYCYDLSESKLNSYLLNKDLALKSEDGKKIYAVPYEITGYGIIINKELADKYFKGGKSDGAPASLSGIKDHKSLKKFAEELNAKKSELGVTSVFASPSLRAEDAWEWQSGILNLPLYYEFSANDDYNDPEEAFRNSKEIDLRYDEEYKQLLDLIAENSTDKKLFATKSAQDSVKEFTDGKAVMMIGSDKTYDMIKKSGDKWNRDNLGFIPLYTDISGGKQGLTVRRERYLAINKKADRESRDAALEFLAWMFSSENGKKTVSNDMGILTPFSTFKESEIADDPLKRDTVKDLADESTENVLWVISEPFKEISKGTASIAAGAYMTGEKAFEETKSAIKNVFKKENR